MVSLRTAMLAAVAGLGWAARGIVSVTSEHKGVLYVKTYKTASSSLAGVLFRYAAEANLTAWGGVFKHCSPSTIHPFDVVTGHNYCGRKGCSALQRGPGGSCKGLGYQPSWMEPKLQGRPFIRVVLVAEPCARLVSSFFYRRLQAVTLAAQQRKKQQLELYTPKPEQLSHQNERAEPPQHFASPAAALFNEAAFSEGDLVAYAGLAWAGDRDAVQWHWLADGATTPSGSAGAAITVADVVASVLPLFHVVGLTEHFDQSLLLLGRALGLDRATHDGTRQLLYARLKDASKASALSASPGGKQRPVRWVDLSPATQAALKGAVRASDDDVFYEAASARFTRDIAAAGGQAFAAAAARFSTLNAGLTAECEEELDAKARAAEGAAEEDAEGAQTHVSSAAAVLAPRSFHNPRHVLRDPRLRCMLAHYDNRAHMPQ